MSERRRYVLLAALFIAFAALSFAINALLADGSGDSPARMSDVLGRDQVSTTGAEPKGSAIREPSLKPRQRPQDGARRAPHAPREAPPPEPEIERRDRAVLAAAVPVARRFLSAFALYEVADLDGRVREELQASATAAFFSELVSQPPRLPPGAEITPARVVGGFELIPIKVDAAARELVEVELVGTMIRAEERTPIALRMRREDDAWRVAGVSQ